MKSVYIWIGGALVVTIAVASVVLAPKPVASPADDETPPAFSGNIFCTLKTDSSGGASANYEFTLDITDTGDLCANGQTLYTRATGDDAAVFRRVAVLSEARVLDVLTIDTEVGEFRRDRYPLTPSDFELSNNEVAAAGLARGCAANSGGLSRRNEQLLRLAIGEPRQRLTYTCHPEQAPENTEDVFAGRWYPQGQGSPIYIGSNYYQYGEVNEAGQAERIVWTYRVISQENGCKRVQQTGRSAYRRGRGITELGAQEPELQTVSFCLRRDSLRMTTERGPTTTYERRR
ncbi:MAG: hypothetical protein KF779_09040 [Hyphomonadaceae bacterium]|nr:hypothetical protein [Hyphomonadaceae bacterium]